MSIFDLLRRRPGLTDNWREDRGVLLLVDLDRFELNGVGLGSPIEPLSFLGPADTPFIEYARKGLRLDVEDGRLAGLTIALRRRVYLGPSPSDDVFPFAGTLRIAGLDRAPLELRGERDFTDPWGAPFCRDADEDETLMFFEFEGREIQVELSVEGVPQILVVSPEPLMADPGQREAYGVDVAWPPEMWNRVGRGPHR